MSGEPTKFTEKQSLLDKIIERVFTNTSFATTAAAIQANACDIVESLWDKGTFAANITDVTYAELEALVLAETVVPLAYYRITDYQTIHLIYGTTAEYNNTSVIFDIGDNTTAAFTPETEPLIIQARNTTTFFPQAISEAYPEDKLLYDFTASTTEDGLISRPGLITYRENITDSLSAYFDWRNTLNRRYLSDQSIDFAAWDTYAGNLSDSMDWTPTTNHALPKWATQIDGSDQFNAGGFVTIADQGGRDFLTFVGYEEEVIETLAWTTPYYKNIHIAENHSAIPYTGSGNPLPVPNPTQFDRNANVVIFAHSAYDIKIGNNCNGITMTARDFRNIEIGSTNQNIYFGGVEAGPIYTTSPDEANFKSEFENIKIGNNNLNIAMGDYQRWVTIGSSNNGVAISRHSTAIEIGDGNANVFMANCHRVTIKNHNSDVLMNQQGGLLVGYGNSNLRLNVSSNFDAIYLGHAIPPFSLTGSSYTTLLSPTCRIHNGCSNLVIHVSDNFDIRSKTTDVLLDQCNNIEIGVDCQNISMTNVFNGFVGRYCIDINIKALTVSGSGEILIGQGCTNIAVAGSTIDIGASCSNIVLISNCIDVTIGNTSSEIYATSAEGLSIGTGCSDIHLRASNRNTIGNDCSNIFYEDSDDNIVGQGCTKISFNNIGLNYKFSLSNLFTNFLMAFSTQGYSDGRYPSGKLPWLAANYGLLAPSLMARENFPDASFDGSHNNTIGHNCQEIYFVTSNGNNIGNGVEFCSFGTNGYLGTDNYSITFDTTTGVDNGYVQATVLADYVFTGRNCDDNSLGTKANNIYFDAGFANPSTLNTIGVGVGNLTIQATGQLTQCSILVPGDPLTINSIAYTDILCNSRDGSGERWYSEVNTLDSTDAGYGRFEQP
jgi:hypothetical protein